MIKYIDKACEKQKESYDIGRENVWFEVGDSVMRTSYPLSDASRRFSAKLAPRKDELVRVTNVLLPRVYNAETSDGRQLSKVHEKHIIPYRGRQPEDTHNPINNLFKTLTVVSQDDLTGRAGRTDVCPSPPVRRRGRPRGSRPFTTTPKVIPAPLSQPEVILPQKLALPAPPAQSLSMNAPCGPEKCPEFRPSWLTLEDFPFV